MTVHEAPVIGSISAAAGLDEPAAAIARGDEIAIDADVRAAQRGDPGAVGRLYERHARMVRAVLLARVGVEEAEDLLQDVFVRAIRGIAGLREGASVGVWLAAIARNEASGWRRGAARRVRMMLGFSAERRVRERVARASAAGVDADEALAAIRRLPEEYREVLVMRLVERMTGPEIAAWSGRSHGAVRVALCRGMELLRIELGLEKRS